MNEPRKNIPFGAPDGEGAAPLPPDLERLGSALDRLGAADRAAAPGGLEDRLFVRTRALLGPEASRVDDEEAPAPMRLTGRAGAGAWRFGIAAGIGVVLVGVAAFALLSSRGTGGGAADAGAGIADVGAELEEVDERFGDLLASGAVRPLASEVSALEAEIDALELDYLSFWDSESWDIGSIIDEEESL